MGSQQSGIIVNLSSGAGIFGFPGGSAYVSSKFAVDGLSESIPYELEPFGIKVMLVQSLAKQWSLQKSQRSKLSVLTNDAKSGSKFKFNGRQWSSS
jgi:short-subunit dehydrogenase